MKRPPALPLVLLAVAVAGCGSSDAAPAVDESDLPGSTVACLEAKGVPAHVGGKDQNEVLLDALPLAPEDARRNIVTRGVDLNALVGTAFRIGDVECFGQRLCEPCAHLERLTANAGKPGTLRALIHKGGLRADLLSDGEIRVGDEITAR